MNISEVEEKIANLIGIVVDKQEAGESWESESAELTKLQKLHRFLTKKKLESERDELLLLTQNHVHKKRLQMFFLLFAFHDFPPATLASIYYLMTKENEPAPHFHI